MKPYFEQDGVTIYHGDALQILPELAASGIGAVVTDPPYSSGGAMRGDRMISTVSKYVQTSTMEYRPEFSGDNRDQRSYLAWLSLWMCAAKHAAKPGAPIVCFTDWRQLPTTTDAVQCAGWVWRGVAVWSKGFGRPNPSGFSSACEFLVWGTNGPAVERADYPPGVIQLSSPRERTHVAEKPVALLQWACRIAPLDATILDPFMGVGTTLLAARADGRKAIGIEIEERYCERAAQRLSQRSFDFANAEE